MQEWSDCCLSLRQSLNSGSVGNCGGDFYLEKQVNKVTAKLHGTTVSKVTEQLLTHSKNTPENNCVEVIALLPAVGNTRKIYFLHRLNGQQSDFENEEYFGLSQHLTLEKLSDTHWPDILTFRAYFNFNSIFKWIAGKRHESQPCSDPPALDTHQGLGLFWIFPSQRRLLLYHLRVKNKVQFPQPPRNFISTLTFPVLAQMFVANIRKLWDAQKGLPALFSAAHGHLLYAQAAVLALTCWQWRSTKAKEKPQGSSGEKYRPCTERYRWNLKGLTWRNSLLQSLEKGEVCKQWGTHHSCADGACVLQLCALPNPSLGAAKWLGM